MADTNLEGHARTATTDDVEMGGMEEEFIQSSEQECSMSNPCVEAPFPLIKAAPLNRNPDATCTLDTLQLESFATLSLTSGTEQTLQNDHAGAPAALPADDEEESYYRYSQVLLLRADKEVIRVSDVETILQGLAGIGSFKTWEEIDEALGERSIYVTFGTISDARVAFKWVQGYILRDGLEDDIELVYD